MKHTKVQHQHAKREKVEDDPEIEQVGLPIVDCQFSIGNRELRI
jgi:hypothetical protein